MSNNNTSLITLFEWNKTQYTRSDVSSQENNCLKLSNEFFIGLDEVDPDQNYFFRTGSIIVPQKFIGYIQIGDTAIQILPKFKDFPPSIKEEDQIKILSQNLLLMLSYGLSSLREIDFINYRQVEPYESFDSFFEFLIDFFTYGLEKLLVRHQSREYINNCKDIRYIKGKIDTHKHIKSTKIHVIPCNFFEFSSDTLINRTLKYCNSLLPQFISSCKDEVLIRKRIKNINALLDTVNFSPVQLYEIKSVHFNRLNKDFEPYIRFCELFLSRRALSMDLSKFKTFSFLFPMQDVYQNFITRILEDYCEEKIPGYHVNRQYDLRHLISVDDGKGLFRLQPDIVIKSKERIELIIDLKYKKLNFSKKEKGIKNSDIYQMYAYGTKTGCKKLCLLYPYFGNQEKNYFDQKWFYQNEKNEKMDLYIRTIDLSDDLSCNVNFNNLINRLFGIIDFILQDL